MKYFLLLLLMTASSILPGSASAQNINTDSIAYIDASSKEAVSDSKYINITDTNSRKFWGIWRYTDKDKVLTLQIKNSVSKMGNFTIEAVRGRYTYTISNKLVKGIESKNTFGGSTHGDALTLEVTLENNLKRDTTRIMYSSPRYMLTYINSNTIKFKLNKKPQEWHQNKNELLLPVGIFMHRQ